MLIRVSRECLSLCISNKAYTRTVCSTYPNIGSSLLIFHSKTLLFDTRKYTWHSLTHPLHSLQHTHTHTRSHIERERHTYSRRDTLSLYMYIHLSLSLSLPPSIFCSTWTLKMKREVNWHLNPDFFASFFWGACETIFDTNWKIDMFWHYHSNIFLLKPLRDKK
jgi:hypothetical protein